MFKLNSKVSAGIAAVVVMTSSAGVATAATASGNMAVGATLTTGCAVDAGAAIAFGNIVALISTGDVLADTGTTFKVACTTGVTPTISTITTRAMVDGSANTLPFNLSLTAGAVADDFPSGTPGTLTLTQNGAMQTITIYGRVAVANFTGANVKPLGGYSKTVVVDVTY
jgi:spore coat protein U-like protein